MKEEGKNRRINAVLEYVLQEMDYKFNYAAMPKIEKLNLLKQAIENESKMNTESNKIDNDFTRDAKFALFEKYNKNKNTVLIYILNIRDQGKLNKWIESLKNELNKSLIKYDYEAAYKKLAKNNYISIEHCKKQYPESFNENVFGVIEKQYFESSMWRIYENEDVMSDAFFSNVQWVDLNELLEKGI